MLPTLSNKAFATTSAEFEALPVGCVLRTSETRNTPKNQSQLLDKQDNNFPGQSGDLWCVKRILRWLRVLEGGTFTALNSECRF